MERKLAPPNFQLPHDAFFQVSRLIEEYNESHPEEMLNKPPKKLKEIYLQGNSVILTFPKYPRLVIAHVALYPFGLSELTNGIELYEFGSWIVHPDFRHHRINGLTIGEYAGKELIKNVEDPIIATIKRFNTLRAFQKLGFVPINFHDHPIISALTCVCPATSEHFHQSNCLHRAQIPGEIVNGNIPNEPPKIGCTLMARNIDRLKELEQILAQKLGLTTQAIINPHFFGEVRVALQKNGISLL